MHSPAPYPPPPNRIGPRPRCHEHVRVRVLNAAAHRPNGSRGPLLPSSSYLPPTFYPP